MTVYGKFGDKFKGRIYAYDYPDELDCGVTAASHPSENITFHLPMGQCGIQMTTIDNVSTIHFIHIKYVEYFIPLVISIFEFSTYTYLLGFS